MTVAHRFAVLDALLTKLEANATLSSVQVEPCDPGDIMQGDSVWFDTFDSAGEIEVPHFGPSSLTYDDTWTLPIEIVTATFPTYAAARDRIVALATAVETVLRANSSLPEAESAGNYVLSVIYRTGRASLGRSPQGLMANVRIEITVTSRITG